jgi:PAS domain S-box-containing protein/diguanylate cyclase (GGDEF)-like protein
MLTPKLLADQDILHLLSKAKIMVLDDDQSVLDILTRALKNNCADIFSTTDEDNFLNSLSFFDPDIIILDLLLKKTNGIDLIGQIKKFNSAIQIITISGQEDIRFATKALLSGAVMYLNKPFELETFKNVVAQIWQAEATRRENNKKYELEKIKFFTLANATPAAIFTVNKNYHYDYINDFFTTMTGYTKEELNELNFWDVVHPSHQAAVKKAGQEMLNNPKSKTMNNEFLFLNKNGEKLWANFSAAYLVQDGEPTLICSVFDITKRKKAEKHARYFSNHDPLTGLYNRKNFIEYISEKIKNEPDSFFAIANINIDRFGNINSLGEKVGDEVLKLTASRLRDFLGPEIIISRGSADDFFILYNLSKEKNINAVKYDLQKKVLAGVFDNSGDSYPCKISASIGICTNIDGHEPAELIKNSQMARRRARREGGNCIKYFEPIDAENIRLREMELELQKALERGEIFLMYQQQVDSEGNHVGMETLVRWNSKKYGLISPTVFIPLAISSGLIGELGLWILKEALRKGQEWLTAGYDTGVISVNVSPEQLRTEDIVKQIKQHTKKTGFPAEKLKLEITETELTDDNLKTQKIIEVLQKMGIKVAIDDFGIGGSNLDRLVNLKFDTLKIDKSLVDNIFLNKNAKNMVKFIIEMGHLLGAKIVAEGVEHNEQFELLKQLGCDEFQGYYFSKPLFPEDIEDKFKKEA